MLKINETKNLDFGFILRIFALMLGTNVQFERKKVFFLSFPFIILC
jgi:hypothetical protein